MPKIKSGVQAEGDNEDLHRALGTLGLPLLMRVQEVGGPAFFWAYGTNLGTGGSPNNHPLPLPRGLSPFPHSARAHRGGSLSVLVPVPPTHLSPSLWG